VSQADDQQLIQQCLAGQTEAFGQLVLRYQDRLFHAILLMVGSQDDARDLAQEAFIHAFRRLDSFRGDSAFYTWLFRIAVNATISFRRKAARQRATSVESARENTGQEPSDQRTDVSPSFHMEVSEQQALVQRALNELSDEFRMALVLTEIEGRSYEEAAELCDCPIGTIRSRVHRARAELKERLRVMLRPEEPT
jgi:RNA polymerase sigma-70 factor (ECF subfamily)